VTALAIVSTASVVELAYMAAALLFILGIKRLSRVRTAAGGNRLAALGMALAIATTLVLLFGELGLWIVLAGGVLGSAIGLVLAKRVPMTAMPEMVGLLNGFGGAASMLVALAEVDARRVAFEGFKTPGSSLSFHDCLAALEEVGNGGAVAIALSILIGAVTFSGSMVAYLKLAGKLKKQRVGPLGSKSVNVVLVLLALAGAWVAFFATDHADTILLATLALAAVALVLGVGLTLPIGGADMPVAISLLNSYSGMAATATGFVLQNSLLIIAGSLVGASGIILTQIMCKAMNRSLANVLFGGLAEQAAATKDEGYTKVKATTAEEVAPLLDAASLVIMVPGYGLAVAQAQHKVRELATLLEKKGCTVKYAIHPVAGRMPGHMNILLAEADVPYEQLYELDLINSEFQNADLVIVLGANDVCNPAATNDPKSPIAGMPVLQVWDARTVVVIKRSLSAGYSGIKNELFQLDNSLMLFADAKVALEQLIAELKAL
jgi:NAD(P) transhydrogenase subunit beta